MNMIAAILLLLACGAAFVAIMGLVGLALYHNLRHNDAHAISDPRHLRPWKFN